MITDVQTINGSVSGEQGIRGKMKDIPSLDKTLTRENFAADAKSVGDALANKSDNGHTHSKKDITDFPQSMPASDVYEWAKKPTKPSYSANEVGARPDNWMPSADEVGARPNTWTPTASDVGARPSDWMPTASDVGAAPAGYGLGTSGQLTNDWNTAMLSGFYYGKTNSPDGGWWAGVVYAEGSGYAFQHLYKNASTAQKVRECNNGTWGDWVDVSPSAFAPSGYGLGGDATYLFAADDMNTVIKCGFYVYDHYSVPANAIHITSPFQYVYHVEVTRDFNGTTVQTVTTMDASDGGSSLLLRRVKTFAGWNPWEYENPPMALGVEYRTTERCNGKVVYAKAISIGNLPNANEATISHGLGAAGIVRVTGTTSNGWAIPYERKDGRKIVATATTTAIVVLTGTDVSDQTAAITVYYTKG